MWIRLTGDMGRAVLVNFDRVSAVRVGPKDVGGSILMFLAGSTLYVQESQSDIMQLLEIRPKKIASTKG